MKSMEYPRFRPRETYRKKTDETIILVDYSNLLYRAWFVSSKRRWVAYAKFFDMLRLCIAKSKQKGVPVSIIFCGESRRPLERRKLSKSYKGNRQNVSDPKFSEFKKGLLECINDLGYPIIYSDGYEADDVIATLVDRYCAKYDEDGEGSKDVIIFSGDRDLQQCLAWKRCYIYRAPGVYVTPGIFEEAYGFHPSKFTIYKALVGDKSDNIGGVNGFGPVKATESIINDSVSDDIWEHGGQASSKEFRKSYDLVALETGLILPEEIYSGPPIFKVGELNKKLDEKAIFEIQRFASEFSY